MELQFISESGILSRLVRFIITLMLKPVTWLNSIGKFSDQTLIVSLHRLGDTILTLHSLRQLKESYPYRRFIILTYDEFRVFYRTLFEDNEIITCSKNDYFFGGRLAGAGLISRLRKFSFSEIIDISGDTHTASLIVFLKAGYRYGISKYHFQNLYTKSKPVRTIPHLTDIYYDAVETAFRIGKQRNYEPFPVVIRPGKPVVLTPFASWPEKEWGLKNFSDLAELLVKDFPVKLVVEKSKVPSDVLEGFRSAGADVKETKNIAELSDEIKDSSFLFGVDSGPVHLAAFHGIPTLAIYGPTNPEYCKPHGAHHLVIRKTLYCSPLTENYCALDAGRKCASRDCLKGITPQAVYEEIIRIVREYKLF